MPYKRTSVIVRELFACGRHLLCSQVKVSGLMCPSPKNGVEHFLSSLQTPRAIINTMFMNDGDDHGDAADRNDEPMGADIVPDYCSRAS